MTLLLEGRNAVIYGGGGSIGGAVARAFAREGATTIMGRKLFSGGSGPWTDDPNARGWWGDDPPFHHAVFVLTHVDLGCQIVRYGRESRPSHG